MDVLGGGDVAQYAFIILVVLTVLLVTIGIIWCVCCCYIKQSRLAKLRAQEKEADAKEYRRLEEYDMNKSKFTPKTNKAREEMEAKYGNLRRGTR
jgi:hypothetical protein